MTTRIRVVHRLPLVEIWDDSRVLEHERGDYLGVYEITQLLRTSTLRFVIADMGQPLMWISGDEVFRFWKDEAKSRIVPREAIVGFILRSSPASTRTWHPNGWPNRSHRWSFWRAIIDRPTAIDHGAMPTKRMFQPSS